MLAVLQLDQRLKHLESEADEQLAAFRIGQTKAEEKQAALDEKIQGIQSQLSNLTQLLEKFTSKQK